MRRIRSKCWKNTCHVLVRPRILLPKSPSKTCLNLWWDQLLLTKQTKHIPPSSPLRFQSHQDQSFSDVCTGSPLTGFRSPLLRFADTRCKIATSPALTTEQPQQRPLARPHPAPTSYHILLPLFFLTCLLENASVKRQRLGQSPPSSVCAAPRARLDAPALKERLQPGS